MNPLSLKAYQDIKEIGLLNTRQLEVFHAILEHPNHTDMEIAELCGYFSETEDGRIIVDGNKARPRRKALSDIGVIEEAGVRRCEVSHFTAQTWKKKDYSLEAIKKRQDELKKKDSKFYFKKIQDTENLLRKLREKHAIALCAETRQSRLNDFKRGK